MMARRSRPAAGREATPQQAFEAQQREILRVYFDDLLRLLRLQQGGPLAAAALRIGGLRNDDVRQGSARLSFEAYYLILDWLYRHQVMPVPGLQVGLRRRFADFGLYGDAIRSARTYAQVLRLGQRWFASAWHLARLSVHIEGPQVVSRYELQPTVVSGHVPLLQAMSAASLGFCSELMTRDELAACEVRYAFATPPDAADYRQRLGCRVRFNQAHNEFRHPAAWLDRVLPAAVTTPTTADIATQAQQVWQAASDGTGWAGRVRHVLQHHCADQFMPMEVVAAQLCVAPRTLRHRLAEEGHSFRALLSDLRLGLARRYLAETRLNLPDIAEILGYAQVSSLHRAYKARYGSSPRGHPPRSA